MEFNKAQPVNTVRWVKRDTLQANDYNPNHVPPAEKKLLKISILEDGWTQPIVVGADGKTIIDGFHRWSISEDKEVYAMTEGFVPVVDLIPQDQAHQKMSTIRHNRARGSHYVLKMSDIVESLVNEEDLSFNEVSERLQMDREEVERLYDHGNMVKRGGLDGFNKGWTTE